MLCDEGQMSVPPLPVQPQEMGMLGPALPSSELLLLVFIDHKSSPFQWSFQGIPSYLSSVLQPLRP